MKYTIKGHCSKMQASRTYFSLRAIVSLLCVIHSGSCLTSSTARVNYCPRPNNSQAELGFTRLPATLRYACSGKYIELYCCVTRAATVEWLRYSGTSSSSEQWTAIDTSSTRTGYLEKNQTLFISAVATLGSSFYQCKATSRSGKVIRNEVELRVQSCRLNMTPVPLQPKSEHTTIAAHQGNRINIECSAFFGSDNRHMLYWVETSKNKPYKTIVNCSQKCENCDDEPSTTCVSRMITGFNSGTLGSLLRISNLTDDGDGRKFTCWIIGSSNEAVGRHINLNVISP